MERSTALGKNYELSYLVSPVLAPERVPELVEQFIKQPLKAATVLSELGPKLIPLAYKIKQTVEHKRSSFAEAYFGSIRFRAEVEDLEALKKSLASTPDFIRHLIVVLPKEALATATKRAPRAKRPTADEAKTPAAADASERAIDQEIDQLLTV